MSLEGLWWVENIEEFDIRDKISWKWTAMIRQPDFITKDMIKKAIEDIEKMKNLSALSRVRFQSLHEGLSTLTKTTFMTVRTNVSKPP
ncbi:MAG: hypothetical protein PHG79_01615 [Methanosarcina sp.]|nr:hypothetical protein [Methanosarcina sp.]HHV25031.1 hypothetical protein [Methanosarcina sp.]